MNVNTLNRIMAAAVVSSVLFLELSIPANGEQQPQQPAAQQQQVARDRLPQQPPRQLTPYRQHGGQGQRAKPRNRSLKKTSLIILKSLGGHIHPLPSAMADMYPWENSW